MARCTNRYDKHTAYLGSDNDFTSAPALYSAGGGLTKHGRWKMAKSDGKYLFNVKAMSKVYRGRFIAALKEQLPQEMTKELVNALYKHNWVVYAKQPFAGVQSAVEYMARYTHNLSRTCFGKIAISNNRIQSIENGQVTFSYKDYKEGSVKKEMALEGMEFIGRFALHILPKKFVRIRYYGICSSTSKIKSALIIKAQLPPALPKLNELLSIAAPQPYNPKQCPLCKKETMETLMRFNRRGPPVEWEQVARDLLCCITNNTTEAQIK